MDDLCSWVSVSHVGNWTQAPGFTLASSRATADISEAVVGRSLIVSLPIESIEILKKKK